MFQACGEFQNLHFLSLSKVDECREMAIGNTFGATSFSSYGAYWITIGVMSIVKDTTENGDTCQAETLMGVFMMVCAVAQTDCSRN